MTTRANPYADRDEAGHDLASRLAHLLGRDEAVVLALPRGGVPVAAPVAEALGAPLDVLIVRKLGVPWQPEVAMGAVAGVGGEVELVHNERVQRMAGVSDADFDVVRRRETDELRRREDAFRRGRAAVTVRDRVVVLVDDGIATGSTMLAATAAIRRQDPARIVVAVPVGPPDASATIGSHADEVICLRSPAPFYAVGQGYTDFAQTSDEEVRAILARFAPG